MEQFDLCKFSDIEDSDLGDRTCRWQSKDVGDIFDQSPSSDVTNITADFSLLLSHSFHFYRAGTCTISDYQRSLWPSLLLLWKLWKIITKDLFINIVHANSHSNLSVHSLSTYYFASSTQEYFFKTTIWSWKYTIAFRILSTNTAHRVSIKRPFFFISNWVDNSFDRIY